MKKKILLVDDSALMRRVLCDIIATDDRFEVADMAVNGAEGFKMIVAHHYDAVVLDVYMPKMTGLEMLEELQKSGVSANVLMASTTTREGARETLTALELGAIDFITKPENVADARLDVFKDRFLGLLWIVSNAKQGSNRRSTPVTTKPGSVFQARVDVNFHTKTDRKPPEIYNSPLGSNKVKLPVVASASKGVGKKVVAIASSTGGPKALAEVIPRLPKNLYAPILLVQHMPKGFTLSLAERLNEISEISVEEAKEDTRLENGHVYIAQGGKHLKVVSKNGAYYVQYTDEPAREGVKPCANYMFESLIPSDFDEVVCVVLTGMGADGTEGIKNLSKKKNIFVISQDEATSTVYGMPRAIALTGLVNEVVSLDEVANQITKEVGVQ